MDVCGAKNEDETANVIHNVFGSEMKVKLQGKISTNYQRTLEVERTTIEMWILLALKNLPVSKNVLTVERKK